MKMAQTISLPKAKQPIAVGLALLLIASGLIALPFTGQATSVSLLEARWSANKVFGLPDEFAAPSCDVVETTFNQVDIASQDLSDPYSSAIDGPQAIQDDWTVGVSYDETQTEPWSLSLFDNQGQELRYVSEQTSWMNQTQFDELYAPQEPAPSESTDPAETPAPTESSDPTESPAPTETEVPTETSDREEPVASDAPLFSDLPVFVSNAQITAAHADALIFKTVSSLGTKSILLSNVEITEAGLSFIPTDEFNDCANGETVGDAAALIASYLVETAGSEEIPMLMSAPLETEDRILGNEYLRFGYYDESGDDSQLNSITPNGNLSQPFYHNGSPDREGWYQLTYSEYPLNMAFGSGTDGTNWTGSNVSDVDNLSPVSQTINWDGWIRTSEEGADEAYGYGVVIVDTEFELNSQSINVRNKYTLGETASFVKIETTLTNLEDSSITNFHIWTGTRDDYVAVTDQPIKYRGTINASGDFEVAESRTAQAASLLVTSAPREEPDGDAVLFYSTTEGTNMIVDQCCGFYNVIDQDPSVGPPVGERSYNLTYGFDGSYGLVLPMGTIAAGASKTITWFYAGGSTGSLGEITRSVGAAAAPASPHVTRSNQAATLTWEAPSIEAGTEIVGYEYRYSTDGGATWEPAVSAGVNRSLTISPLTNNVRYSFQVRAITQAIGDSSTQATGAWSGSSVAEILGAPSQPTITVVRGGDSQVVVTYPAATLPSGITAAISGYQYCLSDCGTSSSWLTLASSPATITGLENGESYSLRIRAVNSNGASLASEAISFKTLPTWTNDSDPVTIGVDRGEDVEDAFNTDDVEASSGSTYSTVAALPDWLTLNTSTGELSGSTDVGGKYIIDLVATNSAGSITKRIIILVIPYVVLTPSPMTLNLGSSVNQQIQIIDGVIGDLSGGATVEVTGLPDGVTATFTGENTADRLPGITLGGTPTTLGTTTITVTYQMADGATAVFEIQVTIAPATRPSGSGGGGTSILPSPPPTPNLPRPTPSLSPIAPSPSPQLNGIFSVMMQIPATPNVAYSEQNPIPEVLVDLLSKPMAYPDAQGTDQAQLPELAPSDSIAFENGVPVVIELVPTEGQNGYVLTGDGWEVALEATDSSGSPLLLDDSGNIILNNDRFVQFTGTGFAPGSLVKVWLFSDPAELSDVVADASGNFVGKAQIPQEIPTGEHTVQLNGLTQDGQLRSVSLGVLVQPDLAATPVAPAGLNIGGLLNILWLIALAVLIALYFIWRRWKENSESGATSSLTGKGTGYIFASEGFDLEPKQQFPDDSRKKAGSAAPPNRKRFSFRTKGA